MSAPDVKKVNPVYPVFVSQYDTLDLEQGEFTLEKMNKVIQGLNRVGRVSNETVKKWNEVMAWVMNEGLVETVTAQLDEKLGASLDAQIGDKIDEQIGDALDGLTGVEGVESTKPYVNLIPNPSDPEDLRDWSPVIQKAIDEAVLNKKDTVELRGNKTYTLKSPILIKQGIRLIFAPHTRVRIDGNFRVFELQQNASLIGGFFEVVNATFDNAVIYLDGKNYWYADNKSLIDGMTIVNTSGQTKGKALHLYSGRVSWNCISFVNFTNISIKGFNTAVHLQAVSPTDATDVYINANRFLNFSIEDCIHCFILDGTETTPFECSGNQFIDFQIQLTNKTLTAFQVTGQDNVIRGFVWDVHRLSHKNPIFHLKTDSILTNFFTNQNAQEWLLDEGEWNNYASNREEALFKKSILPTDPTKHYMTGDQDDVLVNADKFATVTQLAGPAGSGSQVTALFDTLRDSWRGWSGTTEAAPVVLEIDFGTKPISYFKSAGLVFYNKESPKYIKFEFVTSSGGNYTGSEIFDKNTQSSFQTYRFKAVNLYKMKITMWGSNNANGMIKCQRIFAVAGQTRGNAWMSTSGGTMYGDMEMGRATDGIIWRSADGSRWKETIDNAGLRIMTKLP